MKKQYIAIDLKSFYASVECVTRGLDPLTTNLVVADATRTEKTICLAVSPSLKSYGVPGRPRQTGHTLVLGSAPVFVLQEQNIFDLVFSSAWTSRPMTVS